MRRAGMSLLLVRHYVPPLASAPTHRIDHCPHSWSLRLQMRYNRCHQRHRCLIRMTPKCIAGNPRCSTKTMIGCCISAPYTLAQSTNRFLHRSLVLRRHPKLHTHRHLGEFLFRHRVVTIHQEACQNRL